MDAIVALKERQSLGQLREPAVPDDVLTEAFRCALRAPDHRMLRPWRFLVIQGGARHRLGEVFARAQRELNPGLTPEEENRARNMPLRAPQIVVAITCFKEDPKVPHEEQLLSTGAAVQNLLLALHAQGFGSMWRTGPLSNSAPVRRELEVGSTERIAGFIYIGTAVGGKVAASPAVAEHVSYWEAK